MASTTTTTKNVKIFYCGEQVDYVCLEVLWRSEHEGELFYDHRDIDTDNLIENALNNPSEQESWPEMQGIKTIGFEMKDGIMYMSLYDFESSTYTELSGKPAKSKSGMPIAVIENIIIHRDSGNKRLHEHARKKQDLAWKKSNK